ncbi:hypothetical protein LSH36_137g07059 [Paralvinella palmiformis]|uniref:Zinc transporter ZIP9 n=1 Tax=Paralvinella palmiformis TaxID=53620 RepID=A0AAD9JW21_9ANNE|nr:hypothetical protein LSH36_137g07059 [Paralvinella palmiformis]
MHNISNSTNGTVVFVNTVSYDQYTMDDTSTLLLLSFAMLVGCYLAGSVPLTISLSEEKLRLVTVLGAGLLVGTALAVIIPEGVHTLYTTEHGHAHVKKSLEAAAGVETANRETDDGDLVELHSWIGIALVLGFIFMLMIDQLSGSSGHSHGHSTGDAENNGAVVQKRRNITATLGLVVHAAADGIALGAAASTSQTHVEMIVFIAIMLHKAPAAFGLVSFLLHEGFDRTRIRKHLAVFSVAAPLLSVITYFGLSQSSKETLSTVNATGIAMLFSAGTFLYVATVHILPELQSMGVVRTTSTDGTVIVHEQSGFTKLELFVMVIGALLPLLLSVGHHH